MAIDYSTMSRDDLKRLVYDPTSGVASKNAHILECIKNITDDNAAKVIDALVRAYPDNPIVIAYAKAEFTERRVVKPVDSTDLSRGNCTADQYVGEVLANAKLERAYIAQGTGYKIDTSLTTHSGPIKVNIGGTDKNIQLDSKTVDSIVNDLKNSSTTMAPELFDECAPPPGKKIPSPVNDYVDKVIKYEVLRHSKPESQFTDKEKGLLAQLANEAELAGRKVDEIGIPRTEVNRFLAPHIRDCAQANGITKLYDGDKEIPAELLKKGNEDKLCDSNALDTYNRGYYAYFEQQLKYKQAQENTDRLNALSKYPAFNNMVRRYQEQLAAGKAPFVNPFIVVVPEKEAAADASSTTTVAGTAAGTNINVNPNINVSVDSSSGSSVKGGKGTKPKPPKVIGNAISQIKTANTIYSKTLSQNDADNESSRTTIASGTIGRNLRVNKNVGNIFAYLEDSSMFNGDLNALNDTLPAGMEITRDPTSGNYTVTIDGESYTHDLSTKHTQLVVDPSKMTEVQYKAVVNNIYIADNTRIDVNQAYRVANSDKAISEVKAGDLLQSTYLDASSGATTNRILTATSAQQTAATDLANSTSQST